MSAIFLTCCADCPKQYPCHGCESRPTSNFNLAEYMELVLEFEKDFSDYLKEET